GVLHEAPHLIGVILFGGQCDNFQLVRIALLQIDQIRDLRAARPAPCCPKIEQHNLASGFGERNRLAVQIVQLKSWRGVRIFYEPDRLGLRSILLAAVASIRMGGLRPAAPGSKPSAHNENEKSEFTAIVHLPLKSSRNKPPGYSTRDFLRCRTQNVPALLL